MSETTPATAGVVDETIGNGTIGSSHAAFIDKFGAFFTTLSCCIAGYQILQHLRHYTQPSIQL